MTKVAIRNRAITGAGLAAVALLVAVLVAYWTTRGEKPAAQQSCEHSGLSLRGIAGVSSDIFAARILTAEPQREGTWGPIEVYNAEVLDVLQGNVGGVAPVGVPSVRVNGQPCRYGIEPLTPGQTYLLATSFNKDIGAVSLLLWWFSGCGCGQPVGVGASSDQSGADTDLHAARTANAQPWPSREHPSPISNRPSRITPRRRHMSG